MNTYDLLKQAIESKRNVTFLYDALPRVCSPHALGLKKGKYDCLVYQFAGETSKGPVTGDGPQNWKCLLLEKIESLAFTDGEWHTSDNHSVKASCIDEMLVEVKF